MYYKHTGETTTEFIDRLCITYGHNKGCVCGKLDPMARGVTRILFDKDTKLMTKHLNSIKTYEFKLVLGISTDSDDIMGNITESRDVTPSDVKKVIDFMFEYAKRTEQNYHPISAIHIKKDGVNKPLWHWHKLKLLKHEDLPSKKISVFKTELITRGDIYYSTYLMDIDRFLNSVTNREVFRIDDILTQWKELVYHKVFMIKFKVRVSSGFYVRMMAYDIKKELGIPVHVFDIHRTNVETFG